MSKPAKKSPQKAQVNVPPLQWRAWVENGQALFLSGVMLEGGKCEPISEALLRRIVREELAKKRK